MYWRLECYFGNGTNSCSGQTPNGCDQPKVRGALNSCNVCFGSVDCTEIIGGSLNEYTNKTLPIKLDNDETIEQKTLDCSKTESTIDIDSAIKKMDDILKHNMSKSHK